MLSSTAQNKDERSRNRSQHNCAWTHFPKSHTIRSPGLPNMGHGLQIQLLVYILRQLFCNWDKHFPADPLQLIPKQGFITSRTLGSNVKNNRSEKHWAGLAPRLQRLHLGVLQESPKTFCLLNGGVEVCHCWSVVEARRSCGKSEIT